MHATVLPARLCATAMAQRLSVSSRPWKWRRHLISTSLIKGQDDLGFDRAAAVSGNGLWRLAVAAVQKLLASGNLCLLALSLLHQVSKSLDGILAVLLGDRFDLCRRLV